MNPGLEKLLEDYDIDFRKGKIFFRCRHCGITLAKTMDVSQVASHANDLADHRLTHDEKGTVTPQET